MSEAVRPRPALFRALGSAEPPQTIVVDGKTCRLIDIFKHDSWAATARYQGAGLDIVCKFNRAQSILGFPMAWLGRRLAAREALAMRHLAGIPGLPIDCGPIFADGKLLKNAVGHDFICGRPLGSADKPNEQFFPRLIQLLSAVHNRDLAYVDLHKRENVLIGDDGRPHLIDFQVCFGLWTPRSAKNAILRIFLAQLQRADCYHLAKHIRKQRPDQLESLASIIDIRRPWWIQAHRTVAAPLRTMRRWLLSKAKIRDQGGQASSEVFAEDALRVLERKAA